MVLIDFDATVTSGNTQTTAGINSIAHRLGQHQQQQEQQEQQYYYPNNMQEQQHPDVESAMAVSGDDVSTAVGTIYNNNHPVNGNYLNHDTTTTSTVTGGVPNYTMEYGTKSNDYIPTGATATATAPITGDVSSVATRQSASSHTAAINNLVVTITDLSDYNVTERDMTSNETICAQMDEVLRRHAVVMVTRTWCPFTKNVLQLFCHEFQVVVHVIYIDTFATTTGQVILSHLRSSVNYKMIPMIWIRQRFIGGCDQLYALHETGALEEKGYLYGLIQKPRTQHAHCVETAQLTPPRFRTTTTIATPNPLFWFPSIVNGHVNRLTGIQCSILSILSAVFYQTEYGTYFAFFLAIDFGIRVLAGSNMSLIGMSSTVCMAAIKPKFKPGPPKQFAASIGFTFALFGTLFFTVFTSIPHHDMIAAIIMAMLAVATGMEGFCDFCLGCVFFGWGIQYGFFSPAVYNIYSSSREETSQTWDYVNKQSYASKPIEVNTNPNNPIALRYKKKTAEWSKDDFDIIRHMQISYFAMPMSIAALACSLKMASEWPSTSVYYGDTPALLSNGQQQQSGSSGTTTTSTNQYAPMPMTDRNIVIDPALFKIAACISAITAFVFICLYTMRIFYYPQKCWKEWDHPMKSSGFTFFPICLILYAILMYDQLDYYRDSTSEALLFGRIMFWIGTVCLMIVQIAKMGEWIARRIDLEHFYATTLYFPIGLATAAWVSVKIGTLENKLPPQPQPRDALGLTDINALLSRFFFSFAYLMGVTLFVLSFYKTMTSHNSDPRTRHACWLWLATPCILGLAQSSICYKESMSVFSGNSYAENLLGLHNQAKCASEFSSYYFIGVFMFFSLCWATLPHYNFFGREQYNFHYWTECFALSLLSTCANYFYATNVYRVSEVGAHTFLILAATANAVSSAHFLVGLIRKRGVFTPTVRLGPLTFMAFTHDAIRGHYPKLIKVLESIDLDDNATSSTNTAMKENLGLLAAHLNRFRIMHEEHSKHEDQVIFKTFNDLFPTHCNKYLEDHVEDHNTINDWIRRANVVIDPRQPIELRKNCLYHLRASIPDFFDHLEQHLRGEEDNLSPIARKHIPDELAIEMARECWKLTPAERWEVIIPYIINNVPRHIQRIRYLRILTWSLPERSQQIGAIVYRNVDAVMWERIRTEIPEIIPRGAPNWRRQY